MNRRTLDLAIPVLYVIAVIITTLFKNATVVGATATVGALIVGLYFLALRPKQKV